jgi:integrase
MMAEQLIRRGKVWYYRFTDADGKRRMRKGCTDRRVTEQMAAAAELEAQKIRSGLVDARDMAYRDHAAQSLLVHIDAWTEALRSRGNTTQHVKLHSCRALRVVALYLGAKLVEIEPAKPATREGVARAHARLRQWVASARLSELTTENVQKALGRLIGEGRSLQTANHHRNAIKSFARWLYDSHRVREVLLRGLAGYNVKEDPRHERRTVSVEELRQLIEAAQNGPPFKRMTGPMRALCYRLAVASGLRYGEIGSIKPESFNWTASPASVTIKAAYAKNGQTVTLPIPDDLATDLRAYLADRPLGKPIFPLPHDKGAAMVQGDLEAAGIPYQDASSRFFDFHSLRCELATLADAAGVSPRVVQKMMRHSKLEMTGRYTRPRVVDLEAAASMLPSLKPSGDRPEALVATGTEGRFDPRRLSGPDRQEPATPGDSGPGAATHKQPLAPSCIHSGDVSSRDQSSSDVMTQSDIPSSLNEKTPENRGFDASRRLVTCSVGSDRGGTRTLDQRINVPHRLSPTTAICGRPPAALSGVHGLRVWTIPSPSQACRV